MPELLDRVIVEILGDDSKLKAALDRAERSATRAAGKIESAFERAVGPSTRLLGSVTVLGGALSALGIKAVGMAGDMEQARIGLTTMLGSAEAADKHLRELYDFAAKTPFEINGLIDADRRLMAMGFSAEEVIPTLTAIGDAVAAVGGSAELLDRVTLALGQMRAKGKVSGEEMRQLAEAGIPAWEMLADAIGVSIPEAMKRAERGAIDASTGIEAILSGMEQRFAGSMEAQSQTILGMWSNVKDNVTRSMIALGEEITDALDVRGILQTSLNALERFRGWLERGGLRQWWEDYGDTVKIVAGGITGALVPAFVALGTAIWGALAPLTPFIAAGAALAGAFVVMGGTMDDVKVALKTLGTLFSGLWDIFAGFVQGTVGKLAALGDAWRAYIDGVSTGIANMGRAIDAVIHGRFREALDYAKQAVGSWKGGLAKAWGEIADAGQEGADRIYQGLVKISDVVTGQVGASFAEAKEKAQEVADTAASGFGVKVPQAAKAAGSAITTNVVKPLTTAVEKARELGDYLAAASGTLYGRQPKPEGLGRRGALVAPRGMPGIAGGAPLLPESLWDFDQAAREAAQATEELNKRIRTITWTGSSVYGGTWGPGIGRGGAVVSPRWGAGIAGGAELPYWLRIFGAEGSDAKFGRSAPVYGGPDPRIAMYQRAAFAMTYGGIDRLGLTPEPEAKKAPEWLTKLGEGIRGVLSALNPFKAILEKINPVGTIIQGMLEELEPVLEPIVKIFTEMGKTLGRVLAPALKLLTPVVQWLGNVLGAVARFVTGIWNAIARGLNAVLGWLGVNIPTIDLAGGVQAQPPGEGAPKPTWSGWGDATSATATIGIAATTTPVVATPGWVHTFGGHVDRFGQYVARLVEEGIRVQIGAGTGTATQSGIWDRAVGGALG